VCDRALGGRNIDMEIVNHFAQEIKVRRSALLRASLAA